MEIKKLGDNDVIHCSTQEEALAICQLMYDNGFIWCNEDSYIEENRYNSYESETCYCPRNGTYCSLSYFKRHNYNIIPASVFLCSSNYEIY